MRRQKLVCDCEKNMFRHAHGSVMDYKQIHTMMDLFKREMKREWSSEEKHIYWTRGNDKTHLPSYSTMPGLDCIAEDGTFPPCFTSGSCYALHDIVYPDVLVNAVHNSVLIRKYPEAFYESFKNDFISQTEDAA